MKDERKRRASRRVLKKLSAVRAVLSNDEREVLDAIVLGEVRAHQIPETQIDQSTTESTSTNQRKGQNMLGKDNPISKSTAKGTAKAHMVNPKSVNKSTSRSTARGTAKAHMVNPKSVNKSTARGTARGTARAHMVSPKSVNKGTARGTARGTAKAHSVNPRSVNKSTARGAARGTAKAHQMVTTELPAEQAPVTTVPPIDLPKVEFDPTVEQYKPIPE